MSAASEAIAAATGVVGDVADAIRAGRLPSWRADLVRAARVAALVERWRSSVRRARRLESQAEDADVHAAAYRGAAVASSGREAAVYHRRMRRAERVAARLRWRAGQHRDAAAGCRVALEDLGETEAVERVMEWEVSS